ncbi:hypothetical protein XENOCAPTIV_017409 [Xenoophorus captivus]|uniref:Uncharacterized protein n=1 Tax=Xenoophorus captivus TaxID=1517983 RepID=A0ABV0RUF9_9TELE
MVGPGQCLWFHPPQASPDHHYKVSCAKPCCGSDFGLLQPLQDAGVSRRCNVRMAQTGGGNNYRLHLICVFVCAGNEHDCQISRARVLRALEQTRGLPTTYQSLHGRPDSHHRVSARRCVSEDWPEVERSGALERTALYQLSWQERCMMCFPALQTFLHGGKQRFPTLSSPRNSGAHLELLPYSTRPGPLYLGPQSGAKIDCRYQHTQQEDL